MKDNSVISESKDVLGGTPVFRGTSVPIKNLMDYLAAGQDLDEFLDDFPTVTKGQVKELLEIAKQAVLSDTTATDALGFSQT